MVFCKQEKPFYCKEILHGAVIYKTNTRRAALVEQGDERHQIYWLEPPTKPIPVSLKSPQRVSVNMGHI